MAQGGPGVIVNMERIIEEHEVHTGAAAMDVSLAPGEPFQFLGYECHQGVIATTPENLTVTKDAGAGSAYDTLLDTKAMATAANKDIVQYFSGVPIKCYHKDDEIDFAWTNTDTKTYGLTIYWRKLKG